MLVKANDQEDKLQPFHIIKFLPQSYMSPILGCLKAGYFPLCHLHVGEIKTDENDETQSNYISLISANIERANVLSNAITLMT